MNHLLLILQITLSTACPTSVQTPENRTVLDCVYNENIEQLKKLLTTSASAKQVDEYGNTTLWWASERNNIGMMKLLLDSKEFNQEDLDKALDIACVDGNKRAVELLLAHKANPNFVHEDGETPLHSVARGEFWLYPSTVLDYKKIDSYALQNYKDIIDLLIKYGASNDIKNKDGLVASQKARMQQQEFYPELTEKEGYPLADLIESLAAQQSTPAV